ncbi:MAG: hypothetical protein L0216_02495 [Planctomycetales bacterium]|nr:hypothetical protein [Planctomycetales bacterium]
MHVLLSRFIPGRPWIGSEFFRPCPWRVFRVEPPVGAVAVLALDGPESGIHMIPNHEIVWLHALDTEGRHLWTCRFAAGWRFWLGDARLRADPKTGPQLVLSGGSWVPGKGPGQEYYAIREDGIVLVRIENEEGLALRNQFWAENLVIGPPVQERASQDWEGALRSTDPIE